MRGSSCGTSGDSRTWDVLETNPERLRGCPPVVSVWTGNVETFKGVLFRVGIRRTQTEEKDTLVRLRETEMSNLIWESTGNGLYVLLKVESVKQESIM